MTEFTDITERRYIMMKKRFATLLTASMLTAAMAATTLADPGTEQLPQMSETQQMPQAPSGEDIQQMPQAPSENGNAQAPQDGGSFGRQGNERFDGRGHGHGQINHSFAPDHVSFDDLLSDGTISQETYDAIKEYMTEHAPEKPDKKQDGEKTQDETGSTEKPEDGTENAEKPENGTENAVKPEDAPDLLKDLLENSVITQEEYDAISAAREAKEAERPSRPGHSGKKDTVDSEAQTEDAGNSETQTEDAAAGETQTEDAADNTEESAAAGITDGTSSETTA